MLYVWLRGAQVGTNLGRPLPCSVAFQEGLCNQGVGERTRVFAYRASE